jgi:hypothetical protein
VAFRTKYYYYYYYYLTDETGRAWVRSRKGGIGRTLEEAPHPRH